MSWKEVSPGRFERPLDDIEIFFKNIADQGKPLNREHWAVTIYARFRCTMSSIEIEHALQDAWKRLRYDHPEIASYALGNRKIYEVPSTAELEAWMKETFSVKPLAIADDLFPRSRPSRLPTLQYLPQTSEVMLRLSHWRIDGIGSLHLLENLFKAFSDPQATSFGNEWRNLSPGLSEAAQISQGHEEQDYEAASELVRRYTRNVPSIGFVTQADKSVPGITRLSKLIFTPNDTLAITKACKSQGYSVTTAVHAALVVATQEQCPQISSSQNYTSWGSFDFRPYVQPPYNDSSHAASVYLVGLPITFEPSSFTSNTAQLKHSYTQLSSPQTVFKLNACLSPYIREVTSLFSQSQPEDRSVPAAPSLVSLGVVERYLRSRHGDAAEITDFWLATETLTGQITVYVWTWQGRITLSACYNEEFYAAGLVRDFLKRMKGILLSELNIGSDEMA